jgi:hypothetical protein
MEISQFTNMMRQKGALQIVIAPNEPLLVFADNRWQQSTIVTPSERAVNNLLENSVPSNLGRVLEISDTSFTFPFVIGSDEYEVQVVSIKGIRTITVTDKKAPLGAIAPKVTNRPSTISGASAQITREISKGSFNIITPVPSAAASDVIPQNPPATTQINPPPFSPSDSWYYAVGGQRVGPILRASMEQCISSNVVRPETMVWRKGMPDWQMAKLTELEPLLRLQPPILPFVQQSPYEDSPLASINNSSGQGEFAIVPHELEAKGFNWGAFLLAPFWALSHSQYGWAAGVFFPGLIPYIGGLINLVVAIIMANQGYELAWKYRKWRDVDHCLETQRIWINWGIGIMLINILVVMLSVLFLIGMLATL